MHPQLAKHYFKVLKDSRDSTLGQVFDQVSLRLEDVARQVGQFELRECDRETFLQGQYHTMETFDKMDLVRIWGKEAWPIGRFYSDYIPRGRAEAELLSGLHPEWGNSKEFYSIVELDKGVRFHVGKVAPVKAYDKDGRPRMLGGSGRQFLIDRAYELYAQRKLRVLYVGKIPD